MKRSLIYGGVFSFAACSFLFSSCSADKEELESMMDGKSSVSFTAVIDEVSDALRASWNIVDPGKLYPNYTQNEKFQFEMGDQLVALSQGETKTYVQEGIEVEHNGNVNAKVYKNGKAWFFYPSSTIQYLDTTKADVENAQVALTIHNPQDASNQYKCVYLKTNPIDVVDGKVSTDVKFNHLTSLLRFHVLNLTGNENLVVSSIKLEASKAIFPLHASYKFVGQETVVQKDMNFSSLSNVLEWRELEQTKEKMTPVEAGSKTGYIYDALLVTLPIDVAALASTELTISVTFADLVKKDSYTPAPETYTGDELASAFKNGWPSGKRSYFDIMFNQNHKLSVSVSDYPRDWGKVGDEIDVK